MRTTVKAAALGLAALALAGCETLNESYTIEERTIIDEQGVRVTSELQEDLLGANRWFQFRAYNSNDFNVCVQVTLLDGSSTSGHSMGGLHKVGPNQQVDVGYITAPADFRVNAEFADSDDNGECH